MLFSLAEERDVVDQGNRHAFTFRVIVIAFRWVGRQSGKSIRRNNFWATDKPVNSGFYLKGNDTVNLVP